jgi:hypothetical protein
MSHDWLHMLLTMLVISVVFLGLDRVEAYRRSSRTRRTVIHTVILFPLLLVLNMLWPTA